MSLGFYLFNIGDIGPMFNRATVLPTVVTAAGEGIQGLTHNVSTAQLCTTSVTATANNFTSTPLFNFQSQLYNS